MSVKPRILLVDDERSIREMLEIFLKRQRFDVTVADCGRAGLDAIRAHTFDVIVSDIRMPDMTGVELLRRVRAEGSSTDFILLTAYATAETAIQALKMGAFDYILKTDDFMDELKIIIDRALEERRLREENAYLKREFRKQHGLENIIGRSAPMQELFRMIEMVSDTASTVLITGESGTGKELAAKAIHLKSSRSDGPFVSVNCGALTETLLESELFGYVKGAFTGANSDRKGLFEIADEGTIFLDEIGEMSTAMQVKLLRVLQERRVRRVGGPSEVPVDVRVVAATNRDLVAMVSDGTFREDLFYRVSVFPLEIPSLRLRHGDVPLLAQHFLDRLNASGDNRIRSISDEALVKLESYDWPGNVRELENAIERAFIMESSTVLTAKNILNGRSPGFSSRRLASAIPPEGLDLESHMVNLQREYFEEALRRTNGVQVKAAELLGLPYRSFRHYMQKFEIRAGGKG
jgi:two-component system response regulator PilR (NtrC family)